MASKVYPSKGLIPNDTGGASPSASKIYVSKGLIPNDAVVVGGGRGAIYQAQGLNYSIQSRGL